MFIFSYTDRLEENGSNFVGLFNVSKLPISIKKIEVTGGAMIKASVLQAGAVSGEDISETIISTGLDEERIAVIAFKNPSFTIETKAVKHSQVEKGLPYKIIDEEDKLILPVGKSIIIRIKPYINPTGGTCSILFEPIIDERISIKDELQVKDTNSSD